MIISAAIGIESPKFLEYSSGISIYTNVDNIQKVVALVKKRPKFKILDKFLKYINKDWNQIPFSHNNPLPEYLEFKFHRSVLEILRIKPFRKEDKVKFLFIFSQKITIFPFFQEFKLRIISKQGFILKEIWIRQSSLKSDQDPLQTYSSGDISELSRMYDQEMSLKNLSITPSKKLKVFSWQNT